MYKLECVDILTAKSIPPKISIRMRSAMTFSRMTLGRMAMKRILLGRTRLIGTALCGVTFRRLIVWRMARYSTESK